MSVARSLVSRVSTTTRPETESTLFATLVFLVLFGGDPLRDSINWAGWAVVCVAFVAASIVVLVRHRIAWSRLPVLLGLFLLVVTASIAWSAYPAGTALGIVTQLMTTVAPLAMVASLSWPSIVKALGRALRIVVVLSLLFELVVSVFVRRPFCPVYVDCSGRPPAAFYWSRDNLLTGGQIQGLPGNSNLLAIFALLALVVTLCQAADRVITKREAWLGVVAGVIALALTRSSTVLICLVTTAVVLGFALAARRIPLRHRWVVGVAALAVAGAAAVVAVVGRSAILGLLGKSSDLTGRFTIWNDVYRLAVQRPVVGWGWTGYWQPFYKPFTDLAKRNGVVYLQAHDAYLDVWFQLGFVGLALFVALLVTTAARSWWWATDRRMLGPASPAPWTALDLLPLLLVATMLVHAVTESRLIVEWGWAIVTLVCLATRADNFRWWTTPQPVVLSVDREGGPSASRHPTA
ncbi:hypothetical protein AS850_10070 [Frondihabitans sp. 762G35]|uniref:O-antigen ligase family protein n=1 Tax=Frondihabitans sp. 762G35 TaxID=1446794 RepID=UPI000D207810|nr:O-antigen ligase family protein [Frondihabitans sp. 762G35]ARC57421.1 hypothetical protein AS850_10070 [Frondihabitans sp. 762G35]